jgi:hypothetical protein
VHICFGPFAIRILGVPNQAHICSYTLTVLSFVTCDHSSNFPFQYREQSVSFKRIHGPGVRIDHPRIRRRISILVKAATIEHQSTPHHFIWKTAAEPCKLHPHCDITLGRYCETDRSQRSDVRDAPTPPTSQPDIRYPTTKLLPVPVCARDSRFQICAECGKKQSAPAGLFALRRRAAISPGFKVLRSRRE